MNETMNDVEWSHQKLQALAFLSAIGAKAVILSNSCSEVDQPLKILQTIDVEDQCRLGAENAERIKYFEMKIASKEGITVFKKGRNSELRPINIRLKHKPDGDYLFWKSKMCSNSKYFALWGVIEVISIHADSSFDIHQRFPSMSGRSPYIRLTNSSRSLDIRFLEIESYLACLEWIKRYIMNKEHSE